MLSPSSLSLLKGVKDFSDQCGVGTFRSKAHTLRVEKLMGLLRKRALVEKEMMASAKKLENALRAANRELQVALEARVQDGDEGEVGDARKHVS